MKKLALFFGFCLLGIATLSAWFILGEKRVIFTRTSISQDGLEFIVAVPNKPFLVTGNSNGEFKVWDQSNYSEKHSFNLHSHTTSINVSVDGRYIVASTAWTTLIDTSTWEIRDLGVPGIGSRCCFFGSTSRLASVDAEDAVVIYDISFPQKPIIFQQPKPAQISCLTSAFTRFVGVGCYDGSIRIWDVDRQTLILDANEHLSKIRAVCFLADGKMFVSGDKNGVIVIWDVESKTVLKKWQAHSIGISNIKQSTCGNYFFSTAFDYSIKSWDIRSFQQKWHFQFSEQSSVAGLTISPIKNRLFLILLDETVWQLDFVPSR